MAYLSADFPTFYRDEISKPPRRAGAVEWPTLLVAAAIYGGWILATALQSRIPTVLLAVIGGWLIAWHNSLQHEVIHGHPTPWRRVNTALALPPLALWLPYESYRRSHITHHATEHLTEPEHDPESRYPLDGRGPGLALLRLARRVQSTLLGRLVIGPVFEVLLFWGTEAARSARGKGAPIGMWVLHAVMVAALLVWLVQVCRMDLLKYLLCFVYPGGALSLIRSFAEHRMDADPAHRVAVVERAPVMGLLFLNNNLHAAHHDRPGAPWYALPGLYARERDRLLQANGGLVYGGYADVFRRYLWRPHDGGAP